MHRGISRYAHIAQQLQAHVIEGRWQPGCAIPSETELAAMFQVALGTVRKAVDVLVEEGMVERIQGKGTFVRGPVAGSSMFRFFRFDHTTPSSKVLSLQRMPATAQVAQALQLPEHAQVFKIRRVRTLATTSLLETIHVDAQRFAALEHVNWDDSNALLYPVYQRLCGQVVHRAVDTISFGWLNREDAPHLSLPEGSAIVQVHRVAYALNGDVLEVRLTKGDALQFNYAVHIN